MLFYVYVSKYVCLSDHNASEISPTIGREFLSLKAGRRKISSLIPGRACRPCRLVFSVVFTKTKINTSYDPLDPQGRHFPTGPGLSCRYLVFIQQPNLKSVCSSIEKKNLFKRCNQIWCKALLLSIGKNYSN